MFDGQPPPGAREITTGQANRVWHTPGPSPYILKHYTDPARATNEAAALTLLAHHHAPSPRLLAADPTATPAWTAQEAIQAEPVPAAELPRLLARPLAAVHRIPGPHAGRLADARRHPTWPAYLHDRLNVYTTASPHLAPAAARLHQAVDAALLETVEPRILHHDLQPGHLVQQPDGSLVLLDWELAAYGDPLSDLARLAVRLHLEHPAPLLALTDQPGPHAEPRIDLYWHIHQLADTAFGAGPKQRA